MSASIREAVEEMERTARRRRPPDYRRRMRLLDRWLARLEQLNADECGTPPRWPRVPVPMRDQLVRFAREEYGQEVGFAYRHRWMNWVYLQQALLMDPDWTGEDDEETEPGDEAEGVGNAEITEEAST